MLTLLILIFKKLKLSMLALYVINFLRNKIFQNIYSNFN